MTPKAKKQETIIEVGPRTQAVMLAASKDETRYTLNGVYFHEGQAIATDGRMMLYTKQETVSSEELPGDVAGSPLPKETIVPTEALTKAVKQAPKKGPIPILKHAKLFDGELISTDLDSVAKTSFKAVDGTYPNYKQLIPTAEATATVVLSRLILEKLCKAAKAMDRLPIRFDIVMDENNQGGQTKNPIQVTIRDPESDHDLHGVVMPTIDR